MVGDGEGICPGCGAALHGMAICPACGAAVLPADALAPVGAGDVMSGGPATAIGAQSGPAFYQGSSPRLPYNRAALLLLNVALLLVGMSITAWNMLAPPPAKNGPAPQLATPTATATDAATDAPIYTVGVATPHPTSTPAGQGGPPPPPPLPTATPRPRPTATSVPTATPTPRPTPTATPNGGGG